MKKLTLSLAIVIIAANSAFAANTSQYFDLGAIYTGSTFPTDTAKVAGGVEIPKEKLKMGMSLSENFLGLVQIGNSEIDAAARNGGITKIHYVDSKIDKVYVPILFIPIYMKATRTIVYGE